MLMQIPETKKENDVLLSAKGLEKRFGLTAALKGVDIEIRRGKITGLIGENGSGKSTFSSVIAGLYGPTGGSISFQGKAWSPSDAYDAQKNGVSMVVQEMGTIPGIRVADNLFLGHEKEFATSGIISRRRMYAEAEKALNAVGVTGIDPRALTSSLGPESRKLLEIARAVHNNPELLIIDETTTALSQTGRDILYAVIRKLCSRGKGVIFISHDIDELMNVCDSLVILRDGEFIASLEKPDFEPEHIKELMVGRKLNGTYYRSDTCRSGAKETALAAEHVYLGTVLADVSLALHRGEILGIGGLSESGMHELGRVLFGIEKPLLGNVTAGAACIDSVSTAIKCRIGYVSKNRDLESLIINASIVDNMVLASYRMLSRYGIITNRSQNRFCNRQIEALQVKCSTSVQNVSELSGGNKQKIAIGKWLGNESEILILDCPTRGIDIGVKAALYQLMYQLKQEGKSIIMISEELPELIGMSDRIMIMKDGRIQQEFERSPNLAESQLIKAMI